MAKGENTEVKDTVQEFYTGIPQPSPATINQYIENWLDLEGRELGMAIIG